MISRRQFVKILAAASTVPRAVSAAVQSAPFGPLVADPGEILDLPKGFAYRVISRAGERMDDGLLVPARPDGMAAFAAAEGRVALVCNHENPPAFGAAFGKTNERLDLIDAEFVYDRGTGSTPGAGGTTTIIYDPASRKSLRRHLSLAGTELNCAGGSTPWGSWLSCEECFTDPGESKTRRGTLMRERHHGYVFEVPATGSVVTKPQPLKALGRFKHEAAAVDPATGYVYLTEDQHESLLYRFIPKVRGQLASGGLLQALAVREQPRFDTRNWTEPERLPVGRSMQAEWIALSDTDPAVDDLRFRGAESGAAVFARGEGMCYADGSLFFAATIGGREQLGQIFELRLGAQSLTLISEAHAKGILHNADNLTMSPWGDLIICEDTVLNSGLVGMREDGSQYPLANNAYSTSELAGICFSPDGGTMFVNIQERDLTLAITGPWS